MKVIRKKSVAHVLQKLIGLCLIMESLAALVTLVFFIMAISSGEEGNLLSAWPVTIYPPLESTYSTSPTHGQVLESGILINEGQVQFSSQRAFYYLLKGIDVLLVFAFVIYITYLLSKVVRTVNNHQPFTAENAKRLRSIAWLLVLIVPYKLLRSMLYISYIQSNIALQQTQWLNWPDLLGREIKAGVLLIPDLDLQALLTGLVLLIITEVFTIGTALQADKDSII